MSRGKESRSKTGSTQGLGIWIFPFCMILVYAAAFLVAPGKVAGALAASLHIARQVALPLAVAFGMIFALNLLVNPSLIPRFLGKKSGIYGLVLSSCAGILSMGPIYAWYPFVKTLREKGVSNFHTANFLSNRSVKPAMVPVMVAYFGWRFTLVFSILGILSAWLTALVVKKIAD
jgi:uncharacterized membrane protein YraQ (UPF0718 family)